MRLKEPIRERKRMNSKENERTNKGEKENEC